MADVPLSGIIGGGGILKISSAGLGGTIPSGTSTPVTISCPANKFLKLALLSSASTSPGVSLDVGGRSIFSSKTISGNGGYTSPSGRVKIGLLGGAATSEGTGGLGILGGRNEDFVFSFAAATGTNIYYSYEVLEDA